MSEPRRMQLGRAEVSVFADAQELIETAADTLAAMIRARPISVALSGGSTPADLHRALASRDWPRDAATWWFGDERCVPPDHADSNYAMAERTLFTPAGVPAVQVHRMRGEDDPAAAARAYEGELRRVFTGAVPRFDVIVLGIGEDGHTASLFPGTAAVGVRDRWVVDNWVEQLATHRITLTFPVLFAAAHSWVLAVGPRKAEIVGEVLTGEYVPDRHPVQSLREGTRPVQWWLDAPAAARLNAT